MKVLIACEKSGRVREAFAKLGHDAWSCDIQASDLPGNHIQDDVLNHLNENWDLMIAHPPCQYLSYAGMSFWYLPGRDALRHKAAEFFMQLVNAPINRICLENPRGYMSKYYRPYDQVIHPYFFGTPELKRTCLWLKNLPRLDYTLDKDLFGAPSGTAKPKPKWTNIRKSDGRRMNRYFCDAVIKQSAELRAKTFQVIANAMAAQWGSLKP